VRFQHTAGSAAPLNRDAEQGQEMTTLTSSALEQHLAQHDENTPPSYDSVYTPHQTDTADAVTDNTTDAVPDNTMAQHSTSGETETTAPTPASSQDAHAPSRSASGDAGDSNDSGTDHESFTTPEFFVPLSMPAVPPGTPSRYVFFY